MRHEQKNERKETKRETFLIVKFLDRRFSVRSVEYNVGVKRSNSEMKRLVPFHFSSLFEPN